MGLQYIAERLGAAPGTLDWWPCLLCVPRTWYWFPCGVHSSLGHATGVISAGVAVWSVRAATVPTLQCLLAEFYLPPMWWQGLKPWSDPGCLWNALTRIWHLKHSGDFDMEHVRPKQLPLLLRMEKLRWDIVKLTLEHEKVVATVTVLNSNVLASASSPCGHIMIWVLG